MIEKIFCSLRSQRASFAVLSLGLQKLSVDLLTTAKESTLTHICPIVDSCIRIKFLLEISCYEFSRLPTNDLLLEWRYFEAIKSIDLVTIFIKGLDRVMLPSMSGFDFIYLNFHSHQVKQPFLFLFFFPWTFKILGLCFASNEEVISILRMRTCWAVWGLWSDRPT